MKRVFKFKIIMFFLFFSCTSHQTDCSPKKNIYQPFYFVFEEVNPRTEAIKLVKKNNANLKTIEIEILREILIKRKSDFKMTSDNMILISCENINTIEEMKSLSSRFFTRLVDENIIPSDSTLWYYNE